MTKILEQLETPFKHETNVLHVSPVWYVRSAENIMNFLHVDEELHDVTHVRRHAGCIGYFETEDEAWEARDEYYRRTGLKDDLGLSPRVIVNISQGLFGD